MAKSIKLINNQYWDSIGIMHDKKMLSTILEENIAEFGHNSNGWYIKYNNGIGVCFGTKTFSNVKFNTQYGSIWHGGTQSLDFAIPFINLISFNLATIDFGGGIGGLSGGDYTNTNATFYLWHAKQYTLTVKVSYVAYGYWK